ncbi:hypothetical protein BH09ACT3_BH09ACT3_01300 [soil metagenome]
MIPWWGWLLIWGGLALALLAVLAVSAWRLIRTLLGLFDDLGELAGKAELLDRAQDVADDQAVDLAIVLGSVELRRRRDDLRWAVRLRRAERRRARLNRARALIRVDARRREWFPSN